MDIQGDLDLEAILGEKQGARAGFEKIIVSVNVDADMTAEEKRDLLREVERRCPVSDTIKNTTALFFVVA